MKVVVNAQAPRNNWLQQFKLLSLKEASQARPFLEQQVINGDSVPQCWWDSLVSQWSWDGSVSQQAAAPLFSKQAQSSQL